MHDRVSSDELPWKAEAGGSDFCLLRILCAKSKESGSGSACGKKRVAISGKFSDGRGVRPAFSEGSFAGPIIDAFAQPLDRSLSGKSRKSLRDGGSGQPAKVGKAPNMLSRMLDPLADRLRNMSSCMGLGLSCHVEIIEQFWLEVKFC